MYEKKKQNKTKQINSNEQERKPHWVLLNHCATTSYTVDESGGQLLDTKLQTSFLPFTQ